MASVRRPRGVGGAGQAPSKPATACIRLLTANVKEDPVHVISGYYLRPSPLFKQVKSLHEIGSVIVAFIQLARLTNIQIFLLCTVLATVTGAF